MLNSEIQNLIRDEFKNPSLAVTQQYLKIHEPLWRPDGFPMIEQIETTPDNLATAYLLVDGERFYFAITIDLDARKVIGFDTEPFHIVSFNAISFELSFQELQSFTTLKPTSHTNKGDNLKNATQKYKYSSFFISAGFKIVRLETKLNELLDILEQDPIGIKKMTENAATSLQVISYFHNGNSSMGAFELTPIFIQRAAKINLGICFDVYADGNLFIHEE